MKHTINEHGQPIGLPLPGWTPPPHPPRTPMIGKRCRLEPLDVARDAEALHACNTLEPDRGFWTYLPYGPFESFARYRAFLERECLGDDPLFFTIVVDHAPVGLAAYLRIAPASGAIEVGHLHFSPRLRRSAAATEAMFLMMERAFALGYRRYEWKCDTLNAPSRAAAQRLGLSYEGTFRHATVYKGRSRDTAWYAATDDDWPALRVALTTWLDDANFDSTGQQRERLSALTGPLLVARG